MVEIVPYSLNECDELTSILQELQQHYKGKVPPPDEIRNILATLPQGIEILVAKRQNAILGFVTFATLFPGRSLKLQLYVKELFVREAARGQGIGRALLSAVIKIKTERGYTRIDWTANEDGHESQALYENTGATAMTTKIFYRLQDSDG